jgi:hypothetical protein
VTDRLPLDQHTDATLTELYERLEQARRWSVHLEKELAAAQHQTAIDVQVMKKADQQLDDIAGAARKFKAWGEEQHVRAARAEAERERLRTRLGSALACVRLLRIYADGLDHGRHVDASDVARRIRRILTGLDDRPVGDPEPQRQLAAAIEALGRSETELTEARRRIETLEHVAAGNKRHVQLIVPELERAVAERDQHAAQLTAARKLHQPGKDWSWKTFGCTHDGAHEARCTNCGHCHPCPTIRALDPATEGSASC